MWYSFHIYGITPQKFFETLKRDRIKYRYFFINYIDYNGFHVRLRVFLEDAQEKKIYLHQLKTMFAECRVIEKIYDPEYNVYGDSLDLYEDYSVALSHYLVEQHGADRKTMLLTVRKLLNVFDRLNVRYLRYHIAWWEKGASGRLISRIKPAPEGIKAKQQLDDKLEHLIDQRLVPGVDSIPEATKDRLCFQFIHMTLNKMNCTIAEEAAILKWFLKTKEESPHEISRSLLF